MSLQTWVFVVWCGVNARVFDCVLFVHCKTHHVDRQLHLRRHLDHRVETTGCFLRHPDALVGITSDEISVDQLVSSQSSITNEIPLNSVSSLVT